MENFQANRTQPYEYELSALTHLLNIAFGFKEKNMSIDLNIEKLRSSIPARVKLVAISKTHPPESILEAYNTGHRIFGENKVQEMVSKYNLLPKDIEWHLVGHLQTNKVKFIAPFVHLIHSVDSLKLLDAISKEAEKNKRVIDCLLQVYIATEETKYGLSVNEMEAILKSEDYQRMGNIRIVGLMGMASFTENRDQVRKEFKNLKSIFDTIKNKYFAGKDYFKEISMGMSGDYLIAIDEGSTMVRLGSIIFGERNYSMQ